MEKPVRYQEAAFPAWANFRPERLETTGELFCFSARIQFRGSNVDLIVYPNEDGSEPDEPQRMELADRFRSFQSVVGTSLESMPARLRTMCAEYKIDARQLTDREMIDSLQWVNVKLFPDGVIECYTKNAKVTESLDIVIDFLPDGRISDVHFDG